MKKILLSINLFACIVLLSHSQCPTPVTPTVTIAIQGNPQLICDSDPIQFTTTSTYEGNNPSYEWFIGGASQGVQSSSNGRIFFFNTTGNAPYTIGDGIYVIMTSNDPCATISSVQSNTIGTFYGKPKLDIVHFAVNVYQSISGNQYSNITSYSNQIQNYNNVAFCSGSSITFEAHPDIISSTTVYNINNYTQYQYLINNELQPVDPSNPIFTTSKILSNTDIITVRVTNAYACPYYNNIEFSFSLNILSAISSGGTISADQYVCNNGLIEPIVETSAPTGVAGTPKYSWESSPDGSNLWTTIVGATENEFAPSYGFTSDTYFRRVVTDPSFSNTIECNRAYSNTIHIGVFNTVPIVTIDDPGPVCEGNLTGFGIQLIGDVALSDYNWYVNNVVVAHTSTLSDMNIINALNSGDEVWLELIWVCANENPPAPISNKVTIDLVSCGVFSTMITGPNTISPGQQNAVYSVPNQTGFTYTWSITGGTIVSGQNTNSVTVDWDATIANSNARITSATYSISVLETNPSNQTKTTTFDVNPITTSVTISQAQSNVKLFPNPTSGSFNIEMPESGVAVAYEILDVTGLSVASGTFTSTGSDQNISADLNAGMYQVVLKYNNVVTCVRLSKVQ